MTKFIGAALVDDAAPTEKPSPSVASAGTRCHLDLVRQRLRISPMSKYVNTMYRSASSRVVISV